MHEHRVKALSFFVEFKALLVNHMRHVFGFDLHQNHPLVQRFVVFQGMKQRDRDLAKVAGHENRRARYPNRILWVQPIKEQLQWQCIARTAIRNQPSASPPRSHDGECESRADNARTRARVMMARPYAGVGVPPGWRRATAQITDPVGNSFPMRIPGLTARPYCFPELAPLPAAWGPTR